MPVTGRKINLITDVLRLAERSLQETFFVSPKPDENICFTGQCSLYCDQLHPICGKGHTIEGSFTAFYPKFDGSDVIVSSLAFCFVRVVCTTDKCEKMTFVWHRNRPSDIRGRKAIRKRQSIKRNGRRRRTIAVLCKRRTRPRASYCTKWLIWRYLILWSETPTDIITASSSESMHPWNRQQMVD